MDLRNRLTENAREALLAIRPDFLEVPAGRDVVKPDQTVDEACLVEEGVVGRYERFRDGTRRTTTLYIAGDMADLHSIAFPRASWGLSALTASVILKIPHDILRSLADAHPEIALAFWRDTTVDASALSKWVSVLSRQQALRRFAHLLCEYGFRTELAGLGSRRSFTLPITQAAIAEILGVTPTHVIRVVTELRERRLISTSRRSVDVLNLRALEDLADFDPSYLLLDNDEG